MTKWNDVEYQELHRIALEFTERLKNHDRNDIKEIFRLVIFERTKELEKTLREYKGILNEK